MLTRSPGRHSLRTAVAMLLGAAILLTGCGGSAPPAGTGGTPPRTGTVPPGAGQGGDPAEIKPIFEAAFAKLQALDSWRFTSAVNGVGLTPRESTLTGIERRKPTIAKSYDYIDSVGTYKFVFIDGKAWRTQSPDDTAAGVFTVSAPTVGNGSKDDPFAIEGWWPSVLNAAKYFTEAGEDTVGGVAARHFSFTDEKGRERYLGTGITAADWTADLWIARDGGHLLKVAFGGPIVDGGPRDDSQYRYEVSETGCACAVEPPTKVAP